MENISNTTCETTAKSGWEQCLADALAQQAADGSADVDGKLQVLLAACKKAEKLPQYAALAPIIRELAAKDLLKLLNECSDEDICGHLLLKEKLEAVFFAHAMFRDWQPETFRDKQLAEQVEALRNRALQRGDFRYVPKLIVSLTSFPARIGLVYKAVASLYRQTLRPDKVILWLAESQFPKKETELPAELLDYRQLGFEIRWCAEDIRPHKKYYYAMQAFPEDLIVTVDDDLTYDPYMLETLYASYLHFPQAVSAVRAHLVTADKAGHIAPYREWIKEFSGIVGGPSMQLFSTSGAGTLYPPHCMDEAVFDIDGIKTLSPNADDLWLKIMQVRKGTPVVLVQKHIPLQCVAGTQEEALCDANVAQNQNDVQLKNILSVYGKDGQIADRMLAEGYTKNTVITGLDVFTENRFGLLSGDAKQAALARSLGKCERELKAIKHSPAYIAGNLLTFLPRKFVGGIRCLKDNGLKYTVVHAFEKLMRKVRR